MIRAGAAACVLWTATTAPAQPAAKLELQLAADAERRGPKAWTWVRSAILPTLPGWPHGRDPFAQVSVLIHAAGVRWMPARPPAGKLGYLTARLELAGTGTLRGEGSFDGLEVWHGLGLRAPRGRAADLVGMLGLAHTRSPVVLDVRALVARWLPVLDETDPLRSLLALGPAECGELTLQAEHERGRLNVRGRSDGGLLLPALLCVLADLRARPAGAGKLAPITPLDRWLLLASCARDAEREEAARQLALSGDPRAGDMLERLLICSDYTRTVAMEALLRRGAAESLRAIVDAATPAIDATEELAAAALLRWLPQSPRDERQRLVAALAQHASPLLRDAAARSQPRAAVRSRLQGLLPLTASALLLAGVIWRRRTATGRRSSPAVP